ncbi:MAG: DUF4160 domain-containing protein [Pseudomonadota bacterium]
MAKTIINSRYSQVGMKGTMPMPIISAFFGIIIRMYYDDHNPPHIHAEYQGNKALLDFRGNILKGDLQSWTALRLVRDWIDLRNNELIEDWELACKGEKMKNIHPLK